MPRDPAVGLVPGTRILYADGVVEVLVEKITVKITPSSEDTAETNFSVVFSRQHLYVGTSTKS